jgi:myo-inositol-1(or 4)-monophosphatase
LSQARAFAAKAHSGVPRKGTKFPYIVHPLEVARIIAKYYPAKEDLIIAALLHDTIEDTPVSANEIATRFGSQVAALVVGVTSSRGSSWRATRSATLAKLALANPDVVRLKLADSLSNVRSLRRDIRRIGSAATYRKFTASSSADIAWYHSSIGDLAARRLGAEPMVTEHRVLIAALWPKT